MSIREGPPLQGSHYRMSEGTLSVHAGGLDDHAGWLMKKQPLSNRFQKRWFVLETKPIPDDPDGKQRTEIFYFKHHRDKKPCKTPVSLEALKDVVNPSKHTDCIDLVFIDRTFTLKPIKKNTLSAMIFEAFSNLKPSEQAKLTDARGRELLVLQCEVSVLYVPLHFTRILLTV